LVDFHPPPIKHQEDIMRCSFTAAFGTNTAALVNHLPGSSAKVPQTLAILGEAYRPRKKSQQQLAVAMAGLG